MRITFSVLKALNGFVARDTNGFNMLTDTSLSAMVQSGDWLSSIDLKDPFRHIPVAECDRKYFRFRFGESCYQYTRLPCGYALSHQTLSRCLEAALVALLRKGFRLAWSLGGLLVKSSSYEQSIRRTGKLMEYLGYVGFTIDLRRGFARVYTPGDPLGASPRLRVRKSYPDPGEMGRPGIVTDTFLPQGGARDLPHNFQVVELVGCGASGSPTGPVELETSPGMTLSSSCRVWTRQTVLQWDRDSTIRGTL